jgi:cbb3-type cytochrome c oxidase subunit II
MNPHTSHRAIVFYAFGIFLTSVWLVTLLPAARLRDVAPLPGATALSPEAARGREVYLVEGCGYCHTQFLRELPMDRPYGRATVAEDYAGQNPPLAGSERTGPDLSNVAQRQPSDVWHLIHLYNPRAVVPQSVMPGFPWYFETKQKADAADVVVPVPERFLPHPGDVVVARPEALALTAYLLSLKQVALVR